MIELLMIQSDSRKCINQKWASLTLRRYSSPSSCMGVWIRYHSCAAILILMDVRELHQWFDAPSLIRRGSAITTNSLRLQVTFLFVFLVIRQLNIYRRDFFHHSFTQ